MNTSGRKTVKAKESAAKSVKAVVGQRTQDSAARPAATFQEIAKRSYELYLARGAQPGHEVEDWLAAEAELNHTTLS